MKKTINVNVNEIFYIFVLLSFVRIESLVRYPVVDTIYDGLKLIAFVLTLIKSRGMLLSNHRISKFSISVIMITLITVISALINGNNVATVFIRYLPIVTATVLIGYICAKKESSLFFSGSSKYFSFLIWINLLGLIMFPNGIYTTSGREGMLFDTGVNVHILGKANALSPVMLSMLIIIITNEYISKGCLGKRSVLYTCLVGVSIIIMGSATGLLGAFVCVALYMVNRLKRTHNKKSINFKAYLIIALVLTFGIVSFNIQNYFAAIITGLLHKDITLSNRTNVWAITLNYISNNFKLINYVFGTGMVEYKQAIYMGRYAHCHNQFLDQFIQSGIIGLLLYLRLFYLSISNVIRRYNRNMNEVLVLFGALIIAFSIMFVAEVYTTPMIVLMLSIAYSNEELIVPKYYGGNV